MNIAQLSEQLKDVPQPKLIDYARNPNSVVPQFLALAEIQRRQRLQVPQGAPVSSTVANDLLQQANPVPQMPPQMMAPQMAQRQGVPTLPSGMGQQSFAGGGIVAFAEGGEADDDEDELADRQRRARRIGITEKLNEMIAMLPSGVRNPLANLENKPVASARQAQADVPMEAPKKGGLHKYEDLVLSKAQSVNNDPNFLSLARHVLYKETGNLENPESAVSRAGARGIMQLMPATAKMLGVNPDIPEENALGGVTYLNQLYKKYGGDPVLTAAAYNAGPGRVDRILKSGQGLSALPRETRGYIAGLAGGGIVAFQSGGDIDYPGAGLGFGYAEPTEFAQVMSADELRRQELIRLQKEKEDMERLAFLREVAPETAAKLEKKQEKTVAPAEIKSETKAKPEFTYPPQGGIGPTSSELGVDTKTAETSKKADYLELLAQDIERRAEAAKKAGDENKYLAILQAGLGMLGGTSPYAMANIGAGAQKGVETYGALRKAQADEERGILAARLGLGKAQISKEEAEATREATKEYRDRMLGQREDTATTAAQDRALSRIQKLDTDIEKAIRKEVEGNPMLSVNPNKEQIIETRIAQAKAKHPLYGSYYKQAGLGEFVVPSLYSNIPQQAIDALKKNPKLQKDFDAKYGEGSAAKYLGK